MAEVAEVNSGQMEPMEGLEEEQLDTHLEAEEGQLLAGMEMMVEILPLKIEEVVVVAQEVLEGMGREGLVHPLAMRQAVLQGLEEEVVAIDHL